MYTNLLLFLVAIFLFTIESVPKTPWLNGWQALALLVVLFTGYGKIARKLFSRQQAFTSAGYFRTEKQLSVMAICFYAATLYCCDPKYYLSLLSLGNTMPVLVNFAGLMLFIAYLALMWWAGQGNYEHIFSRKYRTLRHIRNNIQANLPIVLPWIIISLLYDMVALLPFPGLQKLVASEWGDLLLFGVFLLFVVLFFPPWCGGCGVAKNCRKGI